MTTNVKKCLRCGRVMYKNNFCAPCLRELKYEEMRKYYKKHPNEKYDAKYWEENDNLLLEAKKKYKKEIRSKYKDYGIADKLRTKVRVALKSKSELKLNTYNALIGCNINELKAHLESKFTEGMTWKNYGLGGWQIDHRIPCQDYDLTDIEEQRKCFHYTNLQPLWAMDNFLKNGKQNRRRKKR